MIKVGATKWLFNTHATCTLGHVQRQRGVGREPNQSHVADFPLQQWSCGCSPSAAGKCFWALFSN